MIHSAFLNFFILPLYTVFPHFTKNSTNVIKPYFNYNCFVNFKTKKFIILFFTRPIAFLLNLALKHRVVFKTLCNIFYL